MKKKYADIGDLMREQWLRGRNEGLIVWKTQDGREIPIKDMSPSHLENAVKYCERAAQLQEIASEYHAYISDLMD